MKAQDMRRLAQVPDRDGPVSLEALRAAWGESAPGATTRLYRLLAAGALHVHAVSPHLLCARSAPTHPPVLPEEWTAPLPTRPRTFAQLQAAWGLPSTAFKRRLVLLVNAGVLVRPSRGVYLARAALRCGAGVPSHQQLAPARHPRPAQAQRLREQRLAGVCWPLRLEEAASGWGITKNAANTYLHRLAAQGWIWRAGDGTYHRTQAQEQQVA